MLPKVRKNSEKSFWRKNFPHTFSLFTADIISCVEFNQDGDLLATGDKGGRVVIFQRDPAVRDLKIFENIFRIFTWNHSPFFQSKKANPRRGEYNVYSTFQSHEPEFDYLKSLEIEEKINKIRWLKRKNPAHFLLSTNGKFSNAWIFNWRKKFMIYNFADKTIKLWKVSERDKKAEGYNLKEDSGLLRDPSTINTLRVRITKNHIWKVIREINWQYDFTCKIRARLI